MKRCNESSQYARTLGSIAFASSIKCAPALDAEFMASLHGRTVETWHAQTMRDMRAWVAGWIEASIAAPLPGMEV